MTKPVSLLGVAALFLAGAGVAAAGDLYPWRNHATPFNFLFGNEIDTHQQTRQKNDRELFGFFYIEFTGIITKDLYRVATHVDCNATTTDCTVGWTLNGKAVRARFLYQVDDDYPVFLVERADIVQPGAFSHFHWLEDTPPVGAVTDGYLLQLTAEDKFCFIKHGAESATSAETCRSNGGVNVDRGIDIATHLNIVTSAPPGL